MAARAQLRGEAARLTRAGTGLAWLGRPKSPIGASISCDSPRHHLQGPSQGQISFQEPVFSGNCRALAAHQVRI